MSDNNNNSSPSKKEVGFEPLLATVFGGGGDDYGSTDAATEASTNDTSITAEDCTTPPSPYDRRAFLRKSSSMDSSQHRYSLLTENMMTSSRRLTERYGFDKVPSQPPNSIKLVTDPNLEEFEKGTVYINEKSIYHRDGVPPEYALTVNTDIYRRILGEVNDSRQVPCGLYFCCHGGDGAHSGVAPHDDHVDIRLAWAALACILGAMMFLELVTPDVDDTFYGNAGDR